MAVRSRQLVPPTAIPAASTIMYTVPAGRTAIVRTMTFFNRTGATPAECRVFQSSTSAANRVLTVPGVDPLEQLVIEHWWAFNPLTTLWVTATVQTCYFAMYGALLLGEPE